MMRKRGLKKSRRCYVQCSLSKAVVNHSWADDRHKYYSYGRSHGKVKYVLVFKHSDEISRFRQVDYGSHRFMGSSKFGAIVDGIIKIEMAENSQYLYNAKWSWEKRI